MKNDKLEQFFADKLEQFEAPYTEGAWERMASQLDSVSSGSSIGKSIAKWAAITVGSAAVIGGIYILSNHTSKESSNSSELIIEQEANVFTPESNEKLTPNNSERIIKSAESISIIEKAQTNSTFEDQSNTNYTGQTHQNTDLSAVKPNPQTNPTASNQTQSNLPKQKEFIAGNLSASFICPGESITIENPSNDAYVRILINDEITTINPGKTLDLSLESSTRISFLDQNNEIFSSRMIEVVQPKQPIIDVVANVYEEGLPIAKFRVFGDYKLVVWDFQNGNTAEGYDVSTNYFDKGQYNVTVNAIDANGCAIKTSTMVEISEKYNLLATNSIRLNDNNYETRTFMPFCLKERNVPFTLTIIDPKDNAIVYTTKEVNKPWDGSDMRTGRPGIVNKTYIWQVQMDEIVPGERGIYSGTITIVE